jgi:hypothetical protein
MWGASGKEVMAGTHQGGGTMVGWRRGADTVAFASGEGHAVDNSGRW